ncbi:MAG: RluA family pseudouridine synthase [Planctomycetota bacterium]
MPLTQLHDSGGVLAITKPAGLPTQAPSGITSVESLVREQLFGAAAAAALAAGRRRHPGGFLGLPHRLDRAVSGVLLLATTPRAARQLARQFERRQIRKTYLAIVAPVDLPAPAAGTAFEWHDTIRKVPDEPRAEIVPAGTPDGREATTHGRVRAAGDGGTLLLELEPVTGRMHQLRVQAAARGLPVVGDFLYGGRPAGPPPADERAAAIALHAWRIGFLDPLTGAETVVTCPPPTSPPWPAGTAA